MFLPVVLYKSLYLTIHPKCVLICLPKPLYGLPGRLEVRIMGCQDLLESIPSRCHMTSIQTTPESPSEAKSLKLRAGLYGRGTNGKASKTDELSCKCIPCKHNHNLFSKCFSHPVLHVPLSYPNIDNLFFWLVQLMI